MSSIAHFFIRRYSSLIKLYPQPFQDEFRDEMEGVYFARVHDLAAIGGARLVIMGLFELFSLLLNLLREHLSEIRKGVRMKSIFVGKPPVFIVRWGSLVFGVAYGLQMIFGLVTGWSTLDFSLYTIPIFVGSYLTGLAFNGIATWFFWRGIPHPGKKWSFLIPVLGAGVISLAITIFTVLTLPNLQIHRQSDWWLLGIVRPMISSFLMGAVFCGLFGWAYQGRKTILLFTLVGGLSKALGFVVWQGGIILAYFIFHLTYELNFYVTHDPWFYLLNLILVILEGAIFGAFLGGAVYRFENGKRAAGALSATQ